MQSKRTKVYLETIGCQMNVADTERASARLRSAGYELTSTTEDANVVLLNSCSVRERAEQKVFNRIGEIRESVSKTPQAFGVLGCVAQLEGETLFSRSSSIKLIAGPRALERLPILIERLERGDQRVVDIGEHTEENPWELGPAERHSPYVAFVPIIEGCNKFCTYCIVPYSRGRESSRRASDILREVRELKAQGYKEIQLLGQNVNSYRPRVEEGLEGFKGPTPFSRLLRAIASTEIERVKFTTSFPRDFHPDIVAAIDEHENLCNWVHLPVQTGSDRILKLMRRGHTVEDYRRRIDAIKNARRSIALTSDVIVGFPGETVEDFDATMNLIEYCQYDGLYIFKYSPRSGTPAYKLVDDVSREEKRERFLRLEQQQKEIQKRIYRGYVGRRAQVLVEGFSARSSEDLKGHSTCHKIVNFKGDEKILGCVVDVRITDAKNNSLYGTLELS
jgi:tRNA-2-methylthio-N6-dimethylallyladenosine synthase